MNPELEMELKTYMRVMTVDVYLHGYCHWDSGAGGFGYVIGYWNLDNGIPVPDTVEYGAGFRQTTRNRMELMAALHSIRSILDTLYERKFHRILCISLRTDCDYMFNSLSADRLYKWSKNGWLTSSYKGSNPQPVKNRDLWEQFIELENELKSLQIIRKLIFTKGYAGNEFHERAYKLAKDAATYTSSQMVDEMYEKTVQNNKTANVFFSNRQM